MLCGGISICARYEIRCLHLSALPGLHALLAKTRQELVSQGRPIYLNAREPSELAGLLAPADGAMGRAGLSLGIFDLADPAPEAQPVAAGLLAIAEPAMARQLQRFHHLEGSRCEFATLCGASVSPGHRSRGLARQLVQWRLRVAAALGLAVVAKVAARNTHSVCNLAGAGLSLIHAEPHRDHPSEWVFYFASAPRPGVPFQTTEPVGPSEDIATLTPASVSRLQDGCIGRITPPGTLTFYRTCRSLKQPLPTRDSPPAVL